MNYIVAYDGPEDMSTVYGWISQIHQSKGIISPSLNTDPGQRIQTPSPSIDGIFILGKGFIYFDNVLMGLINNVIRLQNPEKKWVYCNSNSGNILLFFLFLQNATSNIQGHWLNSAAYLQSFNLQNVKFE